MKKVMVVTSGRWDYSHLYPVLKELKESKVLRLEIIAPLNNYCIHDEFKDGATKYVRDVDGITDYGFFFNDCLIHFGETRPDVVMVLGDRFEIHAAATAALLLNIPIAHIHGGEVTTGAFDNELRNSITMMATWHFASTPQYGRNILNMGMAPVLPLGFEEITNSKVYITGAPGVGYDKYVPIPTIKELERDFFTDLEEPFILAVFHPVTKEQYNTKMYIMHMLSALYRYGEQVIIVMPNIDPSNYIIREEIYKTASIALEKWQVCEDIPHDIFLSLMKRAHMMVGNSSAGIIEAPYYNLPVVNIGTRQDGRIKAENVLDCGYEEAEIFDAMCCLGKMRDKLEARNTISKPYGDGNAAKNIVKILESELYPPNLMNISNCGSEAGD